ncbi:MAG TPA: glycosyltransferase family 2 protein [Ktedonobacterales bacterium]|nr:glycosyltransferase family 2 protein [Ktedonobacterales bacterium]
MNVLAVLRWLLLAAEVWVGLPLLYLALLTTGAIVASRRRDAPSAHVTARATARYRFAVLVPAHDEERVLGGLLESLGRLDYPREDYAICVIADNCADHTAALARGIAGVRVYERVNLAERGKGYALAWMLERLTAEAATFDAYVVIDADAVVDPRFLTAMARALAGGAQALQGKNTVLNVGDSASTALRWIALTLVNHVRPLGRNALGGSSTLTGNGMCLTAALLRRYPWRAFGLAEDYQYYLTLVAHGVCVRYVPQAVVRSLMPTTFRQLRTQDIRWESREAGQRAWQWRVARQLLADGVRQRDWMRLDALAEFLTPPLSVLACACALGLTLGLLLRSPLAVLLGALLVGVLLGYVGSVFYLLRPPLAVYRALPHAPRFAARKLWIYFVLSRSRKHTATWVRTSRTLSAE